MKKFIITEIPQNKLNAGYKAKMDIRKVLRNEGFRPIDIKETFKFDKIPEYFRLIKKLRHIDKGSEVVLQSPVYSFFNKKFMGGFLRALKKRELKLILVIHDLESARFREGEDGRELETRLFSICQKIIVHNSAMKKYILEHFLIDEKKLIELGIFDYLCDETERERSLDDGVAIAGNLSPEKSGYIYDLLYKGTRLNLYGAGFRGDDEFYKGSFLPEELPENLEGAFGLVWDGESIDECKGVTGEYLRINNPHKASLYLASGLPVIVWSRAAIAPIVLKYNLGMVTSSLKYLKDAMLTVDSESYNEMLKSVKGFGKDLREGYFILNAIKRAEEEL